MLTSTPNVTLDDTEMTQVAFVRSYMAPMIAESIRQAGIECTILDGRSHATWEPMSAILVPADFASQAEAILQSR